MFSRLLRLCAFAALPLTAVACGAEMANDAPVLDSVDAPLAVREQNGAYAIPVTLLFHDNDGEAVTRLRYRLPPNIDGMIDVPAANPTKESARVVIVIAAADLDPESSRGSAPGLTSSGDKRDDAKRGAPSRHGGRGRRALELSIVDGRGAESLPQSSTVTLD